MARAFFTAGNAGPDVEQPLAFDIFRPAIGVFEERVAAVDDDVAGFEARKELLDEFVHGLTSFDHDHDAAGFLEEADHFLNRMRADDMGAFGFFGDKFVHFGDGAVEGDHRVAVVVHVEDEILAHDGQTNQCNVRFRFHVQFQ